MGGCGCVRGGDPPVAGLGQSGRSARGCLQPLPGRVLRRLVLRLGWAALVIERYQGLFVQAAKDWALLLQASDQVDEALQLLDRALAADPYDEELYRQAMVLENGRGRADLVARRYRLLRRLMIEELGIEPSMQTSAVLRQLEAAP
ncbi:MAG: bacterial transcriptional activator domain-containing protein [Actinomycetota bacterium]